MADREREREHLAKADRHIAEAKAHMPRQRELLKQLVLGNHEIELAEGLLQALENMLAAFEYHRAIILERLDKMP
jgi:hypothetical protein